MQEPSEGQILIKVRVSGVGPTDLKIRRGDLDGIFPLPEPAVLGFETAGTVDAVGGDVDGVTVGDEVAASLPSLGGYGEYVLAETWTPKPPEVTWNDAAALPASVEAAVGVLRQLQVVEGETLLILGAGGSVGIIATQLAIRNGLRVIGRSARETRRSLESSVRRQSATGRTSSPACERSRTESTRLSTLPARADSKPRSRSPAARTG